MPCREEEEWVVVLEEVWVVPEEEWADRVAEGAAGWEDPWRPVLGVSAFAPPAGTGSPMSGACRARRGNARNVMRR